MKNCKIAILGADSPVAETLLEVLSEGDYRAENICTLSANPYEDEPVSMGTKTLAVKPLENVDLNEIDIVFITGETEETVNSFKAEIAESEHAVYCIDCRNENVIDDAITIAAKVNPERLAGLAAGAWIRCAHPSSMVFARIASALSEKHIVSSAELVSLQPVSSIGKAGIQTLAGQTGKMLNGLKFEHAPFSDQIAFNVLPQTSEILDSGFSREEQLIQNQAKALLDRESFSLNVTCIQVPVFYAQSDSITLRIENSVSVAEVNAILSTLSDIKLYKAGKVEPSPAHRKLARDLINVGRVRVSDDGECRVNLWCVTDNLRKGVANNAIDIAEILIKSYL